MSIVHIVFGSQGAGKTTYSKRLAETANGIHFSIDEWMIELFGPDLPKAMSFPWIMERVQRCEKRIWSTASDVAKRGGASILDLGFMKVSDRSRFITLAEESGLSVQLHYVTAAHSVRRSRILSRNADKGETFSFEVSPQMFDFMEGKFESPTAAEISRYVRCNTD